MEAEAGVSTVVAVEASTAAVQVEVSTRVAASKGEACVPAVHRHRAWAGAIRARCPARLRGSGQDHRQDLAATFIVRIVAPGAEANVPRSLRRLRMGRMDSGIPLAARPQDAALRGPHPGLEIQPARAGRHLAGIGRPVKSARPGVSQGRAITFGRTLPRRETSFPHHAHFPACAAPSRIPFQEIQDCGRMGVCWRRPVLPRVPLSATGPF